MRNWRAYVSILRIRVIASLQYRVAALAGVAINAFWGLILTTIMLLFYRLGHRENVAMTLEQAITYIWLGQCLISLVPMQMDSEAYQKITSGDFAYELCRPLDLYTHWYARIVAQRLAGALQKSWLVLLIAILMPVPYKISPPVSWPALGAMFLALCGALLLSCALTSLMNVFLLRVELGPGLNSLFISLITLFSGLLVPLSIFPDWLQPILRTLPFAGLVDFPCAFYTGLMPLSSAGSILGRQICWIIVLVCLGRWGLKRGLRRTVIQGG